MSFINRSKSNQVMSQAPLKKASNVEMRIDVVPIPTASHVAVKREGQTQAINKIKMLGRDLFEANRAVLNEEGSKRLYQTADLYSESLSLEDMIPMLTAANLTLRLNAVRTGVSSQGTCMELKTGEMANLIDLAADERNEKTQTVSIATSQSMGSMFVGVKVRKNKHYIQKLDYEVEGEHDDKLHVV